MLIPPGSLRPGLSTDRVRDLAATLFAAEAAGVAAWCSETAAGYAGIRRQFGRPIGSFQAVKHLCATMACRAERAAVLAWDAARAEFRRESPLSGRSCVFVSAPTCHGCKRTRAEGLTAPSCPRRRTV